MQAAATTAGCHRFPTPGDAVFVFAQRNKYGTRQTRAPGLRWLFLKINNLRRRILCLLTLSLYRRLCPKYTVEHEQSVMHRITFAVMMSLAVWVGFTSFRIERLNAEAGFYLPRRDGGADGTWRV